MKRLLVLAAAATLIPGCSWLTVAQPPTRAAWNAMSAPERENVDCTTSQVAPFVDSALSIPPLIVSVLGVVALTFAGTQTDALPATLVSGGVTYLLWSSAGDGYDQTAACRSLKEDRAWAAR